jgi:prophage tail gpP-like protein
MKTFRFTDENKINNIANFKVDFIFDEVDGNLIFAKASGLTSKIQQLGFGIATDLTINHLISMAEMFNLKLEIVETEEILREQEL